MVSVEPGSKASSTGPVVTLLVRGRSTSSSGLVYTKAAPGQAKVLGLKLPLRRRFRAVNLDPV